MAEEKSTLLEVVEQLALQAVMLEPDDVMTLGSILEELETIEKIGVNIGLKPIQLHSQSLRKVVEKIIVNEFSVPQEGLKLLREGVTLLQSEICHPGATLPSEKLESSAGEFQTVSPSDGSKADQSGQAQKESLDLPQDLGLYNDFISEALEHLGTIEMKIISLEQSPGDKECINAIFRPFHTIKGVSGFLNLKEINKFSHAMESLLDQARNGKLLINQETIDFILEAMDLLRNMILDLKGHIEEGEITHSQFELGPYLEKIEMLQKGKSPAQVFVGSKEGNNEETAVPPLGEILSARGVVSRGEVSEALKKQADGKTGLKIGEILVKESKVKPKEIIEALRDQKRIASQTADATVKVDTYKLDNLVDLVGELVINQTLVRQNLAFSSIQDQKLTHDFSQLKQITTDLQKISMSLRMIPIRQTFQKMIRLVRDLAKKSGKLIDLVMSGEETEIDRNMVDSLYEPLVHMVRNAVDHGIESPDRRKEVGKAETGQIFLRAYQKGGNVVIEIEDDGRGLNRIKILQKARERGLISHDAQLTDYQIDNLIFEPGFSTADQITEVSGRGVGMDVVKKTIEEMKGKVEIFSVEGKGCRFVMRVPLTLAILDGIIVRIGEERYIVPTIFIKETLRPRREDISTVQKKGELVNIRNSLLPLIRLHQLLGVIPQKKEPWEALVIIVENEGHQRCLMVDDLIGKQEVVIKNLGEKLKDVKGVAGATIMGDGRVGLILDIHGIFEIDQGLGNNEVFCGNFHRQTANL